MKTGILAVILLSISVFPTIFPVIQVDTRSEIHRLSPKPSLTATISWTVLVVLMELYDDPHHDTHTVNHYNELFFGNASFSIRQYYYNNSYGTFNLEGDVIGWYTAAEGLSYYGAGNRIPNGQDTRPDELAIEAANKAKEENKNVRDYDFLIVIHSGDGQEFSGNSDDIWSHQWFIQQFEGGPDLPYLMIHEYVNYETPSHEIGHALKFPDLYDWKNDFTHEYVGPYGMMAGGAGHFSIWSKYYSHVSWGESPQFMNESYRLQISNVSSDTFVTLNPFGIETPKGIMWIELGWNSSGFANENYGRGWTITNRENLDYDQFLPNQGIIIANTQVYPRSQVQISDPYYPAFEVIDAHPESSENLDDAAFTLDPKLGSIGGFSASQFGENWAIQIIERYSNLSYWIRVTNSSNVPQVVPIKPLQSLSGISTLWVQANGTQGRSITSVDISIDNGPWLSCNASNSSLYSYDWNTKEEREGTHIVRARALDDATIPYRGYSNFIIVDVDNKNGSILVVDDDLGRTSETPVLEALDSLGLRGEYEVIQSSSLSGSAVSSNSLKDYKAILWIGNPAITPLSGSHINYLEFKEIKEYLTQSESKNPPRIMVMCSYTLFDFSFQETAYREEIIEVFRASSPKNFRAPTSRIIGNNFLGDLPMFELGKNDTLRETRGSDGEVADLMFGALPILRDENPEFPNYDIKGYYVDSGVYKLVNYMFQPEMVPKSILRLLLNNTLIFFSFPNNSSFITTSSSSALPKFPLIETGLLISAFALGILCVSYIYFGIIRKKR
ncbi:MAG: immune inhibitor A domain-containing protein [Candidatus Thorarchaeota archaeon]